MTDHEMDVCQCIECEDRRMEEQLRAESMDAPDPIKREYLVTATLQLVVREENQTFAIIVVKELLNRLIEESEFRLDPMNGAIIEGVQDLGTLDDDQ